MRTLLSKKSLLFTIPIAGGSAVVAQALVGGNPPVLTHVAGSQVVKVDGTSSGNPHKPAKEANGSFAIAGGASGLYPGAKLPLVVTLTNPQSFGIRATPISVAGRPAVPAGQPIPVAVDLAKEATATTPLDVGMIGNPPDACQGASFALAYSATAAKS